MHRKPIPSKRRTEGHIKTPDLKLFYRRTGTPSESAPPLFALHGGPGASHDILVPGLSSLANHREVILYDQRGCGRSEPMVDEISCTFDDNVEDLENLRTGLGLEKIDLVGHSWGGLLALGYALRMGENVRKIILITPALTYYPNPSWQEFLRTLSSSTRLEMERVRASQDRSEVAKAAALWRLTVREFFHHKEAQREIDLAGMSYSPKVAIRLGQDLKDLDLRPQLRRLKIPALIIAGKHDPRLALRHHQKLARYLPETTLVVMEKSGHFPFLEEKERFVRVVEKFLS